MACLNGDGSLTVVAGQIVSALARVSDPAEVASATGLPLYRVRGGLRELALAGIVEASPSGFMLTARGREFLTRAAAAT